MTGIILDAVLMLLLVCAVGYGIRLEKKLVALRQGQLAFAQAVTELNMAASRAEAALANLRASGQETDLLHDRIMKAREVKGQLEALIARGGVAAPVATPVPARLVETVRMEAPVTAPVSDGDDERALRMAALARRIQEMSATRSVTPSGRGDVDAILGAMTVRDAGNPARKAAGNPARRSFDEDLFAA